MSLEKQTIIDSINVLEDGHIQVRQATKILEDSKEISKTYHRWVIYPGQSVSGETQKVQDIAGVVHTQAVIDAYEASLE